MNPYLHPDNEPCRRQYDKAMCETSLEILDRTIMIPTHPLHDQAEIDAIIHNINAAATVALGNVDADQVEIRTTQSLDRQKFDMATG